MKTKIINVAISIFSERITVFTEYDKNGLKYEGNIPCKTVEEANAVAAEQVNTFNEHFISAVNGYEINDNGAKTFIQIK